MSEMPVSTHHEQAEAQSLLNQVDAILAVEAFQDAFNKFKLLDELAPKIEQHKDAITVYVGKEIERIIRRQEELESEFQVYIKQRDEAVSQQLSSEQVRSLNEQVQQLAQRIQDSTKELCKNLKENPSVTENLGKTQTHRSDYKLLVEKALVEFREKMSYGELEHQISSQFQILQEHEELQKREAAARKEVEDLKAQIAKKKAEHVDFMAKNQKELGALKEDLTFERERVSQCLSLLATELKSSGDEMGRIRQAEYIGQKEKIDHLLGQIALQQQADDEILKSIQMQTELMSKTATDWGQKREQTQKLMEVEKAQLEKERNDKAEEIRKLEEQVNANKTEKENWVKQKEFEKRMNAATLEARTMRMEISRKFVQDTWEESLCVTKKKAGKRK